MKIAQINATCGSGSTGKICVSISHLLSKSGIENYIFYSAGQSDYPLGIKYMHDWEIKAGALESRVLGNYGFDSTAATKRLVNRLKEFQPDTVHLHNLHGHNCDLETLFTYLKEGKKKIFWTFHDCWAFTGHCSYFTMVKCEQWRSHCSYCPLPREFSWFFDTSSKLFEKKKRLFQGLDMTIITPSQWLADLVKQSFLKDYPVKVIYNGIDLSIFHPTPSDFRKKHGIDSDKKMLLGVAFGWGKRKGLDVFCDLAKRLAESYQIVLVGTDDSVDQQLPPNMISIHRTENQRELAEIYTAADVFVNPTREDNFPTTNLESLACGTPVITFKTGGSPEALDETCGSVVPCDDVDALEKEIKRVCSEKPYPREACLERAKAFDMNARFEEYVKLYQLG